MLGGAGRAVGMAGAERGCEPSRTWALPVMGGSRISAGQEEQRAGCAPPETGGLVAGLRPLQLIVGGIGAGLAVLVASVVPTVAAPVALLPGLAVLVFALARIGGELALDRALTAAGFLVRRLRGRFASGAHERGSVIREPSAAAGGTGRVGAPRSWGRLRIVSHEVERGSVGVLLDEAAGTVAGVLVARADTAPLLDTAEAMRRAEEFAALIVSLARDARPVRRVSFVARRLPADAGEHAAWFAQRRAAPLSATVVGTYADLVEQVRGDAGAARPGSDPSDQPALTPSRAARPPALRREQGRRGGCAWSARNCAGWPRRSIRAAVASRRAAAEPLVRGAAKWRRPGHPGADVPSPHRDNRCWHDVERGRTGSS